MPSLRTLRTLRTLPDDETSFARLDVAVGASRTQLVEQFLLAVSDLVTKADLSRLRRVLIAGNFEAAVSVLDWGAFQRRLDQFIATLAEAVGRGALEGLKTVPPVVAPTDAAVAQSLARRAATQYAGSQQAATLVREISEETRAGLRRILGAQFQRAGGVPGGGGFAAVDIARTLRGEQLTALSGLTRHQANAVLRAAGRILGPAPDPVKAANVLERLGKRAVARRAKLIAATEASNAVQAGKVIGWQSKVASGELDPARWRQEWVSRLLDTTCERCEAMDGETAEIGGVFVSSLGERSSGPTLHPRCYCVTRLVRA